MLPHLTAKATSILAHIHMNLYSVLVTYHTHACREAVVPNPSPDLSITLHAYVLLACSIARAIACDCTEGLLLQCERVRSHRAQEHRQAMVAYFLKR